MSASPIVSQHAPTAAHQVRWFAVLLSFLTILLDGFDTTAIGFVVPVLSREWGLPPAAFSLAFVATSLGAVTGYVLSGYAEARWGRRHVVLGSVALFALGSAATALVTSVPALAWLRLITGIGLGAALPAAIALGVENGPPGRKEAITIAVAAGMSLGATLGGIFGGPLMAKLGWQGVFWAGAVLPALLLPLLIWGLPADAQRPPQVAAERTGVKRLLQDGRATTTLLLWLFAFLIFAPFYALNFWVPTLLGSFGFAPMQAPLGVAALGVGGLVGSIVLVPLTAAIGVRRVLVGTSLLAAVLVVLLSQTQLAPAAVLGMLGGIGACLVAGTLGQSALAVSIYPAADRTTGVGWGAACGRVGSMVGPAVGGLMLSLGQAPRDMLLAACVPVLLAAVSLMVMGARSTPQLRPADAQ